MTTKEQELRELLYETLVKFQDSETCKPFNLMKRITEALTAQPEEVASRATSGEDAEIVSYMQDRMPTTLLGVRNAMARYKEVIADDESPTSPEVVAKEMKK